MWPVEQKNNSHDEADEDTDAPMNLQNCVFTHYLKTGGNIFKFS